jgi:type I restriction enzyme S subunit
MRKYPKYKVSGVDWLGLTPIHWDLTPLKFCLKKIYSGGTPESGKTSYWSDDNSGIPWVAISDISSSGRTLSYTEKSITYEGLNSKHLEIIPKGILLISIFASLGKTTRLEINATVNQAILGLLPNVKLDNSFLDYFLKDTERILNYYSSSNTQENLNLNKVKNLQLILPSLPEQHAIVRFLDYKTGQIDSFIANRQKQIELLKEQKAGIINKAVTKGIYPNAKMKDSGIDWIGVVPKHWMIGKVRRVLNILTDFTANGSFADLAKNVKYLDTPDHSRLIRLTDLREDLKNEGIYVNKEAHKFLSKSELFGGEILMANVGAYAGLVCLVPKLDFIATLGPNMFLLKFDEKRMSNQFAFTLLGSDCYYKLLINKALSSAQPKLNKEDVKSIDFIFPPTQEEQKAILDWIKEETSNVDTLISKYQKQIDLMQEYRTSLISQAVTGKIDVREWQPKKQETA